LGEGKKGAFVWPGPACRRKKKRETDQRRTGEMSEGNHKYRGAGKGKVL